MHRSVFVFALAVFSMGRFCVPACSEGASVKVEKCLDITPVWSGHPVGFALLTHTGLSGFLLVTV